MPLRHNLCDCWSIRGKLLPGAVIASFLPANRYKIYCLYEHRIPSSSICKWEAITLPWYLHTYIASEFHPFRKPPPWFSTCPQKKNPLTATRTFKADDCFSGFHFSVSIKLFPQKRNHLRGWHRVYYITWLPLFRTENITFSFQQICELDWHDTMIKSELIY